VDHLLLEQIQIFAKTFKVDAFVGNSDLLHQPITILLLAGAFKKLLYF